MILRLRPNLCLCLAVACSACVHGAAVPVRTALLPEYGSDGDGAGAAPADRAKALLALMTQAEKVSMLHGHTGSYVGNVPANDRLKIPALNLNDGPQGFRDDRHPGTSTAFPSGLTVAATWDEQMAAEWGDKMSVEFWNKGSNVMLGPAMCLARVPTNGRNFEYMSGEDPILGKKLVAASVKAIQANGVIANAKHWVLNNQETNRQSVSSNTDARTRFEVYYPPFEGAVEAGVGSFMCSYNKINHVWSCENPETLGDLKQHLGFEGWVMSDWGATHSNSIVAGLDQEMPGGTFINDVSINASITGGHMKQADVDGSVLRILTPMFQMGLFDRQNDNAITNNVTSADHALAARTIATSSMVLLKNDNHALPLSKASTPNILVAGSAALQPIVAGGGSGHVSPSYLSTPLDAIRNRYSLPPRKVNNCSDEQYEVGVDYFQIGSPKVVANSVAECCQACANRTDCLYFTFQASDGSCWFKATNEGRMQKSAVTSGHCGTDDSDCAGGLCVHHAATPAQAEALAGKVDAAVVFVETSSSEGSDRKGLSYDDDSLTLIQAVASQCDRTIVVMVSPGAVLTPFAHSVEALIAAFMPGQEYGNAVTQVLFGDVNPSGKLPLTFPNIENEVDFSSDQYPGADNAENATYSEGLLVGYRWYDAHNVTPAFAFGHGLSYTSFTLSDLYISSTDSSAGTTTVSVNVSNVGDMDGQTVVQLYLVFPSGHGEPVKQLKAFQKVAVEHGDFTTVSLELTPRDTSVWNTDSTSWEVVEGDYVVMVGLASDDLPLSRRWTVRAGDEDHGHSLQDDRRAAIAATEAVVKVGCLGDSITYGAHSSSPSTKSYPAQLQKLLGDGYQVTNLGESGSTMQRGADSPYYKRRSYQTLVQGKWDHVVIMMGTNDAKEPRPPNWHNDCLNDVGDCQFVQDYLGMIEIVRGLGTTPSGPEIYVMVPPPLMHNGVYGMNATVINGVFPRLIRTIHEMANLTTPIIDVFTWMGGTADWQSAFPSAGCTVQNSPSFSPVCPYFCDSQSCDQCHPNDNGYAHMAARVRQVLP